VAGELKPVHIAGALSESSKARAVKVLPENHKLGMKVTKGGSMCDNCRYLASETTCGNPRFVRWNGSATLPEPDNEYCCDLWEA
jgi:hypothetical protein